MQKYANLVELEHCCQTHIFLQNFVLIQLRTSPPKNCKFCKNNSSPRDGAGARRPSGKAAVRVAAGRGSRRRPQRRGRPYGTFRDPRAAASAPPLRIPVFENFAIFWRARSRLYQNEILQENMRLTAFFKLYKICILLHRCNLKILAKKSV